MIDDSHKRISATRRRGLLLLAAACTLFAIPITPVLAWGRIGHRVSAKITDAMLTSEARRQVRALLEEGESLADASTWADENRDADRGSATWHYVNVPLSESTYSPRFCNRGACVVSKIAEMKAILADTKRSKPERRRALRYLIHFVQDVHQPMHVGDNRDKGGNDLQVTFFGDGWNLHAIWDAGLLRQLDRNEDRHLARLRPGLTAERERNWSKGKPEDWATESLLLAKRAYINPDSGARIREGDRLGPSYVAANREALDEQLLKAGVRVADILNDLLK
jgi:hypothetical protein